MSRPDTFILLLNDLKREINLQIMHCKITLEKANDAHDDVNYNEAATELEKSNISSLITLITNGLEALQSIVWE